MKAYRIIHPSWEFIGADGARLAYGQDRFDGDQLALNRLNPDGTIAELAVAIGSCAMALTGYHKGVGNGVESHVGTFERMWGGWSYMFGDGHGKPMECRKLPSGTIAARPVAFADLAIGQDFDWVDPTPGAPNSFFHKCRKVSARCYAVPEWSGGNPAGFAPYQVGTNKARVFHVQPMESKA